ncbi:hypothetical protein K439DRAFT_818948 [Ramaria rubella]|nr:hypothetical protein K439DRAFT_818948 [Ramaria rubella]
MEVQTVCTTHIFASNYRKKICFLHNNVDHASNHHHIELRRPGRTIGTADRETIFRFCLLCLLPVWDYPSRSCHFYHFIDPQSPLQTLQVLASSVLSPFFYPSGRWTPERIVPWISPPVIPIRAVVCFIPQLEDAVCQIRLHPTSYVQREPSAQKTACSTTREYVAFVTVTNLCPTCLGKLRHDALTRYEVFIYHPKNLYLAYVSER